ncbi:MAG: CcmD family protein [Cytophagales bacterium]|nr:CcmD family protein [Bernardetiaceae bacterium]MDW8209500.1 CcmD family protein [Cytophagales bacterium]
MKKFLLASSIFITTMLFAYGQHAGKIVVTEKDYDNQAVEMADTFRREGKIYVVVGTLGTVLTGLLVYLVLLDRKITKLEKSEL